MDDPRRSWADLAAGKLALLNHALDGRITHTEPFRGFLNRELAARLPLAWGVVRDRVGLAETPDAASCPAVSLRRFDPHAVQLSRYLLVGHQSRQLFDESQCALCGLPTMLTGFTFAKIELGMGCGSAVGIGAAISSLARAMLALQPALASSP